MNITVKTLSALTLAAAALAATVGSGEALTFREPAGGFHCFTCTTQTKPLPFHIPPGGFHCLACNLPHPTPPTGSRNPGHGGWGHGYGWQHGFGRPEIVVEGQPAAAVAVAPVAAAPVAQVAAAEPCNCLTKQTLPDGSVLFQDICTKESAIAAPQTVGAR